MHVLLIAAMTADGLIGQDAHHLATSWTNEEDQYLFTEYVRKANNMVMGLNTFRTTAERWPGVFNKTMPGRRLLVYTPDPSTVTRYKNVEAVTEPPAELVKRLDSEGVQSLAICGGTTIYTMFMQAGVVDDLYIDMQATLFGKGVSLFNGELQQRITIADTKQLGPDNLLIHYKVLR